MENNITIQKQIPGLMLSAIISDTLLLRASKQWNEDTLRLLNIFLKLLM